MLSNSPSCCRGCEFCVQPHINLQVSGKTEAQLDCMSTSWMCWNFFFSISHIEHPPALRLLPSSPLLFLPPPWLSSDWLIQHDTNHPNRCHSANTSLIFTKSAILCLCLPHPYSPCTALTNCLEVFWTSIYFYFLLAKLLFTGCPTPLYKALLLWGKSQVGKRRRQPAVGTCAWKAQPLLPKCAVREARKQLWKPIAKEVPRVRSGMVARGSSEQGS